MNKFYFLFLLTVLFGTNQITAQCPENAYVGDGSAQVVLIFDPGPGPDCLTRPDYILVDGATTYSKAYCSSNFVVYDFVSGPTISDPNSFSVDYDGSTCNYTNNLLPVEVYQMINNASLKVYPNPVLRNGNLNVEFSLNTTAKFDIYNVTGKLIINDKMDNLKSKSFNVSSLKGGVYFLKIQTDNSVITKKFVISD